VSERLFSATPTRLDAWVACPRRYRFHYLDRPRPARAGPWAHLSLGSAVHLALARWWSLPVTGRDPLRVADLVVRAWADDGFRDGGQSARWRERARSWVHRYVADESRRRQGIEDPVRVEATLSLRCTTRVALSGRPDRIDLRPSPDGPELVVVDYKTGRRDLSVTDTRTSRTLAVYAAAAAAVLHAPATRVELHHLPSGRIVSWRHGVEARDRHVARAVAVAEECREAEQRFAVGAAAECFPTRPGPLCAWCDYRVCCPEGAASGPPAAPWAAVEPDGEGGEPGGVATPTGGIPPEWVADS
jgi:RecB family exonuclease